MNNKIVFVNKSTIFRGYLYLLNIFKKSPVAKTVVIHIDNFSTKDFPQKITGELNQFYESFINSENYLYWRGDNEWTVSFYRRLIQSNYGVSQFDLALETLKRNKNSRRAVLNTYLREKDDYMYRPALTCIHFLIENGALNINVSWRSKELYYAFPINTITLFSFMRLFYFKLLGTYPDLKLGSYTEVIHYLFINQQQSSSFDLHKKKIYSEEEINRIKFYWGIIENDDIEKFDKNYEM
ncbi:MAG: thymidylate synthase [Cetobacterium sp.]|uniref:thymidylate synthase n=1 Tax=Cetobacterium sp. TaxID=2071632 RepID=UPI003EE716CA